MYLTHVCNKKGEELSETIVNFTVLVELAAPFLLDAGDLFPVILCLAQL